MGTVVSPDPAGVTVRTGVPDMEPGVDTGGDVLLNVHPADARTLQRTIMITSMTLNCIVKNASLSYIMLVPAHVNFASLLVHGNICRSA